MRPGWHELCLWSRTRVAVTARCSSGRMSASVQTKNWSAPRTGQKPRLLTEKLFGIKYCLMKSALLALAFTLSAVVAMADPPVDTSNLPPAVQRTIKEWKSQGEVKKVKTVRVDGQVAYEVEYKEGGDEKQILIGQDGSVIGDEKSQGKGKAKGKGKGKGKAKGQNRDRQQPVEESPQAQPSTAPAQPPHPDTGAPNSGAPNTGSFADSSTGADSGTFKTERTCGHFARAFHQRDQDGI